MTKKVIKKAILSLSKRMITENYERKITKSVGDNQ